MNQNEPEIRQVGLLLRKVSFCGEPEMNQNEPEMNQR